PCHQPAKPGRSRRQIELGSQGFDAVAPSPCDILSPSLLTAPEGVCLVAEAMRNPEAAHQFMLWRKHMSHTTRALALAAAVGLGLAGQPVLAAGNLAAQLTNLEPLVLS